MTEYWKSNPMFWCEYCKVWMQDKPAARATHEKGIKHKDNVARKLREMRVNSDREVKEGKQAAATMGDIEAKAQQQYEADLEAAEQTKAQASGRWVYDAEAKLHYNEQHQYYYSKDTQMYYGGEPPAWTTDPPLSAEARFPEGTREPKAAPPRKQGSAPSGRAKPSLRVQRDSHPLGQLGGYQMPDLGAIGGAKGVGVQGKLDASAQAQKRAADHGRAGKGQASDEEAAALARREAARARVNSRSMAAFGLK